uniref:Cytochrome P450 n=1 Tax=Graphocephala atropunctata TaxID=36148 RepID=A0A1B6MFJ7_9HEMI
MLIELIILVTLIVTLRKVFFKSRAEKLYAKIPGPRPYPIIGNMFHFNYPKEEPTDTLRKLSYKYGPVYLLRLGRETIVCVRDPGDVEVVLSNYKLINKPDSYKVFHPWVNQGLFTSSGEDWRKQRKLLTPAFHVSVLQSFIPSFERCAVLLIDNLSKMAGKDFDVSQPLARCSLDIICETAMGLETNVQTEKKSTILDSIDELTEIMTHRSFSLLQSSFLFPLLKIGRRHDRLVDYLHGVTEGMIKKRREKVLATSEGLKNADIDIGIKQKKPFLDLVLEYSMNGAGMTDLEIRQQVDTFMVAGYDTSQTAMSFTLYCLSHHPAIQERVYQEIVHIFGDSDRDATYQDLQEMKYLENVIKESMRVYPVSRFIARVCCEDITLKSGYVIPENSIVVVLTEAMYHDPAVNPDPHTFNPDRFEKSISLYTYLHFGAGPRNCVGQKFAMLEMKSVLSRVIRTFRILPSDIPLDLKHYIVLKSSTGVNIRIEPRHRV